MARMRRLRAEIAPHDSAARLAGLGIDVFLGDGRFVARDAIEVGGTRLRVRARGHRDRRTRRDARRSPGSPRRAT